MRLVSLLSALLVAYRPAAAHRSEEHDHSTITSSASLVCTTGDAQSRYESCSSSISSKVSECADEDLGCACGLAASGFGCLTSYCNSHTEAICSASYLLNGLCAPFDQPRPTLSNYNCPSSISDNLASLIPTNIDSLISSEFGRVPSDVPFLNRPGSSESGSGNTTTGTGSGSGGQGGTSTGEKIQAPSVTGAANGAFAGLTGLKSKLNGWKAKKGGETDPVGGFLGVGVFVAVFVAGVAAFL